MHHGRKERHTDRQRGNTVDVSASNSNRSTKNRNTTRWNSLMVMPVPALCAVMICATLVNIQTDRQTAFDQLI